MAGDERYSPVTASSRDPLAPCRWASSTSIPEGPNGNPIRLLRPRHPRNLRPHGDERRGDRRPDRRRPHLRQGHGAGPTRACRPRAGRAGIEEQGLGWKSYFGSGKGDDTITSGIEGAWTPNPIQWDNGYLRHPVRLRVGADQEPGRCLAVEPYGARVDTSRCPRSAAHAADDDHADMALRMDPVYEKISRASTRTRTSSPTLSPGLVQADPPRHGPRARYLGPECPDEELIWQDPFPPSITTCRRATSRASRAKCSPRGLSVSQLVITAWASASTFRGTDKRGGANGARIRLAPQKDWDVNSRPSWPRCCERSRIQWTSTVATGGKKFRSPTDRLGGCRRRRTGGEEAGHDVAVPFTPGRTDASQEQTDVDSFGRLEPRRTASATTARRERVRPRTAVDRAQLLTLTAPEMTVWSAACVLWTPTSAGTSTASSPTAGALTQRLLRQPAGYGHRVAGVRRCEPLRGRDRQRAS